MRNEKEVNDKIEVTEFFSYNVDSEFINGYEKALKWVLNKEEGE